ncbi:MAG: VpsF family polysaccharide biosynthesis protein [Methylobacterium frigidaeris]
MTGPGQEVSRDDGAATPLYSALFLTLSVLILMRIGLNGRVLDLVMNYTAEGGTIIEKIHPAFWGLLGTALVTVTTVRVVLDAWELRVVRALLGFCAVASLLLVLAGVSGRSSSVGYLLDSYVTLIVLAALFAFPAAWRRGFGHVLLGYLILSALLGIVEFALGFRLMPYSESEAVFRPTALASHPLEFGLWCTAGLGFVAASDWRPLLRAAAAAALVAGCVVSGARLATLVSLACAAGLLVHAAGAGLPPDRRQRRRLLAGLGILILGPLALGALAAAGALGRFGGGIADENAMARIDVYGVFRFLSWSEILLGTDINAVLRIVNERFGLPFIESSFVVFVVQFGLFGAALFLGMLARLVRAVAAGAPGSVVMALCAFFLVALSNNTLSTKTTSVFLIVSLAIAFRSSSPPPLLPPPPPPPLPRAGAA